MQPEPFLVDIPQSQLDDLRTRLDQARLAPDFDNDDWAYGVDAGYLLELLEYWRSEYDWRAQETAINAFPNFRTTIDDVPIHFIHVKGRGPNPMPLILSHGWPWCFWDYHELIGPLSDPAAYGGDERDAFDVIVPSLPGFAFSSPLTVSGINFWRTADLWRTLMRDVLGYERFAAQGGDWGNLITGQLGHRYPDDLIGIHLTGAIPLGVLADNKETALLGARDTSTEVAERFPDLLNPGVIRPRPDTAHATVQVLEPQTLAYAMHDSPLGLLAWILQRRYWWSDNDRGPRAVEQAFSKDHLLTVIMLYWLTDTFVTSVRYYAEVVKNPWRPDHDRRPVVQAPTAITFLDHDMTSQGRGWTADYYNLRWTNRLAHGGHFAPAEVPQEIVQDIRDAFRDLRA